MSEYQYYEFQALDRRLTDREMAVLRSFSTRARITPTSFVNDYEWGDFKGNPDEWVEKYFDAFLYFANWGTRILQFRIPSRLLDVSVADAYCAGESASVRKYKDSTIVTFTSSGEDDDEWQDETDALSGLVSIRTQLAQGDLRALYIGWLLCAQGELGDEEEEPPVPPGLGTLDGSLERLVDFLRLDEDLLDVAAAASLPLQTRSLTQGAIQKWLSSQRQDEKDAWLARFIAADDPGLALELQREISGGKIEAASGEARTVAALLQAGESAAEERRRAAAARAEAERKRREHEAALARAKYLDDLAQREPAVWTEVDHLIATKQPASYDRATGLLVDLRDIAAGHGRESTFRARFQALVTAHERKPSFLARIKRAGLQ